MENKEKCISIVLSTYNSISHIANFMYVFRTLKTVEVELIVVDGESTDGTRDVLSSNIDIIDILIEEKDTGIYNAWNKGVRVANASYIMFLGSDDILLSTGLKDLLEVVRSDKSFDFISSKAILYGKSARLVDSQFVWREFMRHMRIPHPGSLHNRSLFLRFGEFNESFKLSGDYEFLLRSKGDIKYIFLNSVTVLIGDSGLSRIFQGLGLREAMRAKMINNTSHYAIIYFDFFNALVRSFIKHSIFRK